MEDVFVFVGRRRLHSYPLSNLQSTIKQSSKTQVDFGRGRTGTKMKRDSQYQF